MSLLVVPPVGSKSTRNISCESQKIRPLYFATEGAVQSYFGEVVDVMGVYVALPVPSFWGCDNAAKVCYL